MKIAFIGYRGMVGSVLVNRMIEEGDFDKHEVQLFSTSQAGSKINTEYTLISETLGDAFDLELLTQFDCVLTCQGSDYTSKVYPRLKQNGWKGYWVDAASLLRMDDDSVICLDPINLDTIKNAHKNGVKTFVGGNCTVSLMLMGVGALFKHDLVEWVSSMTYQAASGAGAKNMIELLNQMKFLGTHAENLIAENKNILEIDKKISEGLAHPHLPADNFGFPLAGNILPWIDTLVEFGQSREEWKGMAETNKILETKNPVPIDGTCVRVGAMRSHAQALTIKLKKNVGIDEISQMIQEDHAWSSVIANTKESTLSGLTPAAVSGTLDIPVGRLRKMKLGDEYLNAFTVGDQLLWGAAEPLRRMVNLLSEL